MEVWNFGIMVLNQKEHLDATQYSVIPTFHPSSLHPVRNDTPLFCSGVGSQNNSGGFDVPLEFLTGFTIWKAICPRIRLDNLPFLNPLQ